MSEYKDTSCTYTRVNASKVKYVTTNTYHYYPYVRKRAYQAQIEQAEKIGAKWLVDLSNTKISLIQKVITYV